MKEVKTPKSRCLFYYGIVLAVIFVFNLLVYPMLLKAQVKEVDYGTFMKAIEEQKIDRVQVEDTQIVFTEKEDDAIYKTGVMDDPGLTERLYQAGATFAKDIDRTISPVWSFVLTVIVPILIFIGLGQYMSKKLMEQAGGKNAMSFGMGKSNARVYVQSTDGIRFDDVAGEDEAKENLAEVVDYLHNPQKYTDVGASMPKWCFACRSLREPVRQCWQKQLPVNRMSHFSPCPVLSSWKWFVGMGASKVRDLFKQAKEKAPCIVFIDEIDAIGKKRDGQIGGNDEREQTLNQLLTEMDGFEKNNGVIILAATNRPETLDPALTRPGRFDRRVPVELPDRRAGKLF